MLNGFLNRWVIRQPRLRRFLTRLIEKDTTKFVEVLGTSIYANSIKEHGYVRAERLARRSSLLRDEVPVMLNVVALLADGDTFVDVGANVGAWCCTIVRFRSVYSQLTIWAFEANPDTFSRLVKSAEGHAINVANVAISNRSGELKFVEGAVSHVFTTIENASSATLSGQTPVSVTARRLDAFAISGDSLIIKLDVEGQELEVLQGAEGFFEARRVKAVYVDGFKNAGVPDFLRRYGFRILDGRTLQPVVGDAYVYSLLALAAGR